jgi:hypothetical protein
MCDEDLAKPKLRQELEVLASAPTLEFQIVQEWSVQDDHFPLYRDLNAAQASRYVLTNFKNVLRAPG